MPRRLSRSRNVRSDNGWSGTAGSKTARSTLPRSDDALSEVIGFILIIAILMIFLSLWMVYVVPAEGRQQEIEHMNYVRNWFTQYKVTADSLWVNHNDDKSLTGMTFSNSLVLGSQGGTTQAGGLFLPVMSPVGSTGAIVVTNKSEFIIIRDVHNNEQHFPLAILEFETTNNYWIPQSYYYQMGGVFLRQPAGTVARVAPLINFNLEGNDAVIMQISSRAKSGMSGQGPVRIDTELNHVTTGIPGTLPVTFELRDEFAAIGWEKILKERRALAGLNTDNVIITQSGSTVSVSRPDGNNTLIYGTVDLVISVQSIASVIE
ncbi:hypothetical protein [Methanocalculus sp. MC3]